MTRYLIAGGSGFIGRHLSTLIEKEGGQVVILTRSRGRSQNFKEIQWNPTEKLNKEIQTEVEKSEVIINLAGSSIGKRWTSSRKDELTDSRIDSTSSLVNLINEAERKPKFFVSASAIGYYGNNENDKLDENGKQGVDFLANLSIAWEKEAIKVDDVVKLIIPRFGIVLGKDGGAFPELLKAFSMGVNFNLKSVHAWKSWIHIDDVVSSILFMVDNNFEGIYNCVSPNPVEMIFMADTIRKKIGKGKGIRIPKSIMKTVLGEGGVKSIYEGQYVLPRKLTEMNFKFKFENLEKAINSLI